MCADEFSLTHKNVFVARRESHPPFVEKSAKHSKPFKQAVPIEAHDCYYCHEFGHLIATCPSLKKKSKTNLTKSVEFIQKVDAQAGSSIDMVYDPYVCQGMISLSGLDQDMVSLAMLRDTRSNQSFVLASFLPFSEESYCVSDILVQAIEMGALKKYHCIMCTFDLV